MAAFLACGCLGGNPHLAYMRAAPQGPASEFVPPGKARVVFVSNSRFAGGAFPIIDEGGRFIGESAPGIRFSSLVAPLLHRLGHRKDRGAAHVVVRRAHLLGARHGAAVAMGG